MNKIVLKPLIKIKIIINIITGNRPKKIQIQPFLWKERWWGIKGEWFGCWDVSSLTDMSAHEKWMKIGLSASQTNFRTSSESCVRSPVLCLRSAFLLSWTVSSVRPDSLCMPMTETFQTEISWNWSLLSTEHHSIPGQVCVRLCITPYHSWNDALLTLNLYGSSNIKVISQHFFSFFFFFCDGISQWSFHDESWLHMSISTASPPTQKPFISVYILKLDV